MEIIFLLLFVFTVFVVNKGTAGAWTTAAERLGLTQSPTGLFHSDHELVGEFEGMDVRIHTFTRGSGKSKDSFTSFEVTHPHGTSLAVGSEGLFTKVSKALGSKDVQVGDPDFDDRFHVQGDPLTALALFTPDRRLELDALWDSGHSYANGMLDVEVSGTMRDANAIVATLESAVQVARLLAAPQEAPVTACLRRVHDSREDDTERALVLRVVDEEMGPNHDVVQAALALLDGDVPAGPALLRQALEVVAGRDAQALTTRLPRLFDHPALGAVAAALALRQGVPVPQSAVRALLASDEHRRVGLEHAHLHAGLHDDLVALLSADLPAEDLALACDALGRVGTIATVQHLLPLTEGLLRPSAVKRAAQGAITRLQEGVPEGARGGLSLAQSAGTEGALSQAREAGRLSRPQKA